jgi:hypothetical protein
VGGELLLPKRGSSNGNFIKKDGTAHGKTIFRERLFESMEL